MLTPDQINQARAQVGIPNAPTSLNNPTGSLKGTDAVNNAWGASSSGGNMVSDTLGNIGTGIKNYASDVMGNTVDTAKNALQNLQGDVETGAQGISNGVQNPNETPFRDAYKTFVRGGIGTVSDLAQLLLSPITGTIGASVKNASNALSESPAIQNLAQSKPVSGGLDAVNSATQALTDWSQKHPDASKGLLDTINTALLAVGGDKVPGDIAQTSEDLSSMKEGVSNAIDTSVQGAKDLVGKTGEILADLSQSGPTYYHGTTPENAQDILQNGFDVSKARGGTTEPVAINLTTNQEDALHYAGGNEQGLVSTPFNGKNALTFNNSADYIKAVTDQYGDYTGPNASKLIDKYDGVIIKNVGENGGDMLLTNKPETLLSPEQKTSIDAVNPDLSSKKLIVAYKDIVTGGRTAERSSITGTQGISENQNVRGLGVRLADVIKSKDPLENLNSLSSELDKTETKLEPLIENDKTTGTQKELTQTLEDLKKTAMPREYNSIKESKNTFKNVIDFAQEMVVKNEESTKGFRSARTAFDNQAKTEFPSAYKDGYIDTKTPAGRAIKLVRDTINDYTYNKSEGGPAIKNLIKREADIFRATDNIAPKAAKLHGSTAINRFFDAHPMIGKILTPVARAVGVSSVVNALK